jgi:HEAT repeat protein
MPLVRKTPAPAPRPLPTAAAVAAALAGGNDDERWAAARAAGEMPDCIEALGDAVARERNPRIREAIFTSLVRLSSPRSVELLLPLLRSDDAQLRTGALDALSSMKDVARPYVQQLLHDADADVRILACELARHLPGAEASRVLCALLDEERVSNVCASAVEVLAEVGGPEALPALARCAQRFAGTAFLEFSIRITVERIQAQAHR